MTKLEPMTYPWTIWCIACAVFCLWAPLAHGTNAALTLLAAGCGSVGWIWLTISAWVPEKKNVQ